MLVNHKLKALFLHIPKTGGTAIRSRLTGAGFHSMGAKHAPLKAVEAPERFSDYFIFCFVRNPYTRLVSFYRMGLIGPHRELYRESFSSFKSFLQQPIHRDGVPMALCQADLIRHPQLFPAVYKYEGLEAVLWDSICRGIGIVTEPLPRDGACNYWGDYDYREYLDAESIAMINELCSDDFELFGYQKIRTV